MSRDPLHALLAQLFRDPRRRLRVDAAGFVAISELTRVVQGELESELTIEQITRGVIAYKEQRRSGDGRWTIEGTRVRVLKTKPKKQLWVPDILYHACTAVEAEEYQRIGGIRIPNQRLVPLLSEESDAWREAHRRSGEPRVLVIDTSRGRRRRLHVTKGRHAHSYLARRVSVGDVLNLQPEYREQVSAGGIPVARGPDGRPRFALIRVRRRSGETWEIAKGKLEPGEPPEWAAIRETQEEMGVSVPFEVGCDLGHFRYGFLAPGGRPRLKTVYVYLLRFDGDIGRFQPAEGEGVAEVRWFGVEQACESVTHSSLIPMMRKAAKYVHTRFDWGDSG